LKKLAIVSTHPIQYNAPWFQLLSQRGKIKVKVFYTWSQVGAGQKFDPGFAKEIKWDIPLLEGYEYCFVQNTAANPGSHNRSGIINPTLNKEIEEWEPNAILIFGWNFISHYKCMKYFYGKVPILFRGDSTLMRKQPLLKGFIRKIYLKWVYHYVEKALYVGTQNKKYFLHCGLAKNQLKLAPHAIDNIRFADIDGHYQLEANKWKQQLGIEPFTLTILYAGKLEAIKNPQFIVNCARHFEGLPVHFIIVGNGPLESALKKLAEDNLSISFIDFQNQQKMPIVYRLAHFFMLCSESETWGLGVNEAMASGRGILLRDTCGCAVDLVQNNTNGFVYNVDATDDLYSHIHWLINNPVAWKAMGASSEKIIKDYSFENIVAAVEETVTSENY
jgi:glycosyltransferase involved in cell wall biosynthesis